MITSEDTLRGSYYISPTKHQQEKTGIIVLKNMNITPHSSSPQLVNTSTYYINVCVERERESRRGSSH